MGTESLEKYQTWQVTVDEMQVNKAEKAYFEKKTKTVSWYVTLFQVTRPLFS